MAKTPYDIDLDRNPANYQPLTPLGFLERAAAVFPDHIAIIPPELRVRARRLASALSKNGVGRGDIVSVFLANTPAMLECHYGAPMCQGVLNTLNTRLDAPIIAFSLDHADAKVVITDREYSKAAAYAMPESKFPTTVRKGWSYPVSNPRVMADKINPVLRTMHGDRNVIGVPPAMGSGPHPMSAIGT
jgi:fatty-acyl-CoA synthase